VRSAQTARPTSLYIRYDIDMDQCRRKAAEIAKLMKLAGDAIPPELRLQFIELRAELFQRGIFDPVLARFDSATAPKASVAEIVEELEKLSGK
jgi:hypothetical protein